MSDHTDLVIQGIGLPPYSVRGVSDQLRPVEAARSMRRTVNGALVDLSVSVMRKYRLSISCTDQQPIAANGIWPGQTVVVDCVTELAYETDPTDAGPERTVVPGSSRIEGDFTFYRPRLTCLITDFRIDKDEAGAEVGWTLELEEV